MPSKTLIFLHIHKTGGTSFNNLLTQQYSPQKTLSIYGYDNRVYVKSFHPKFVKYIEQLPQYQKQKVDLVRGHFGFGFHELLPQECDYLTILREPVSRFISHFYFIQEAGRNSQPSKGKTNNRTKPLSNEERDKLINMSLEDYITSISEEGKDNIQTRALAGHGGIAYTDSSVTEETLEMAKHNLRKYFPVVGVLENFDAFLLLCQKYYVWNSVFYKVLNKNKKKPQRKEISADTIAQIRELNHFDIKLYEFCKLLMQEKIDEYGSQFQADLKRFQSLNQSFYGQMICSSSNLMMLIPRIKRIISGYREYI